MQYIYYIYICIYNVLKLSHIQFPVLLMKPGIIIIKIQSPDNLNIINWN